jgi:uncharacterized membrane protein
MGGRISAFAGAAVISISALVFMAGPAWLKPVSAPLSPLILIVITVLASLAGVFSDSLLGAVVQAMYYCTKCRRETEQVVHACGEKTVAVRGIPWFDNDLVNLASSMAGGVAAALIYLVIK